MSNSKIEKIKSELEIIRKNHKGLLTPEIVVEYAKKNKGSALHGSFEWNDKKASEQYRLYQAAHIIRSIKVEIQSTAEPERIVKIRAYVSLPEDRGPEGVYRSISQVLTEDDLRLKYIESVQDELSAFQNKLASISEIASKKFKEVEKVVEKEKQVVIKKIQAQTRP